MSEEKTQFSTKITTGRLSNLNIYCKIKGKTQEEVLAEMVDNQIPNYSIKFKEM